MFNFKSLPSFKIIMPFITGIVFCLCFQPFKVIHIWFIISIFAIICSFLFQYYYKKPLYFKKALYIFFVNIFLFLLAHEACFFHDARNDSNHYSHYITQQQHVFTGVVNDIPVDNKKFIKLSLNLTGIVHDNKWRCVNGNTVVYLKKDKNENIDVGNTILINSKFTTVNEPNNPNEFDYKNFLHHKNIFHTVFAKSTECAVLKINNTPFNLSLFGTSIKSKLVSILRNCDLTQHAFSICTALLVGYDDEIISDVVQQFSHSGTLHILSVSGMHTAVLYGILIWFFNLFDKNNRYKKIRCVSVICCLILFVVITGLSPSVLRAALMLTLILIGKTFYRHSNGYNTLLLSAFILLISNPYLIIDIGFQLSYFAVFGIMYLYPILQKIYVFENRWIQKLYDSMLISIAATIFTFPICLYYFHQFPIWFALSNLIIIPISMAIMISAIVLVCLYKIIFFKIVLVFIINYSTYIMLWFAQLTDNSRYGFIDNIVFDKLDLTFCSITMFGFLLFIFSKHYKHIICTCCVIGIWTITNTLINFEHLKQTEFISFHVKQKSVQLLRVGNTIYINSDSLTTNEYQRIVKPYILNYSGFKIVYSKANVIKTPYKKLIYYNKSTALASLQNPDYIIVSNNASIILKDITKKKPTIIADCSNNYNFVKQLKKQCLQAGFSFYSVKDNGAFKLKL